MAIPLFGSGLEPTVNTTNSSSRYERLRWLRLRYSLRGLLVLMLLTCSFLGYRLQSLLAARDFVGAANSQSPRAALSRLSSTDSEELHRYCAAHNYPDWHAEIVTSPFEVIWSGKCEVDVSLRWSKTFVSGSDKLSVQFRPLRQPTKSLTNLTRHAHSITIL